MDVEARRRESSEAARRDGKGFVEVDAVALALEDEVVEEWFEMESDGIGASSEPLFGVVG